MHTRVAVQNGGWTAAALALDRNHPFIFATLDPEAARQKGEELRESFDAAWLVFVISTRFRKPDKETFVSKYAWDLSCDPFRSAQNAKKALEGLAEGIRCFDPTHDNAFLMGSDAESANGVWFCNWRGMLERARLTGGRVVQIVTPPGLSDLQVVEADMAKKEGVAIVQLDCTLVNGIADERIFKMVDGCRDGWAELSGLADKSAPRVLPPTREELLEESKKIVPMSEEIAKLREENEMLRTQNVQLTRAASRSCRPFGFLFGSTARRKGAALSPSPSNRELSSTRVIV